MGIWGERFNDNNFSLVFMLGDTLEAWGFQCNQPHEAVPHKGIIASGGHLLPERSPPGALPYTFPSFLYFHFFSVVICYLVIMFVKNINEILRL